MEMLRINTGAILINKLIFSNINFVQFYAGLEVVGMLKDCNSVIMIEIFLVCWRWISTNQLGMIIAMRRLSLDF